MKLQCKYRTRKGEIKQISRAGGKPGTGLGEDS